MNIWILNHYALPPNMPGGTRHFDISRELVKNGYNVTIFASSFHYSKLEEFKKYDNSFFIEENIDGVNFVWIKTPPYYSNGISRLRNMLAYNAGVKKYLKKANLDKPEIIIGSTVHLFAVNLAYKLAKKLESRFIAEIRDFWPYTLVALGKMSKIHPLVLFFSHLEKKLYKKADKIITLFDNGYKYLEKFVSHKKLVHLPNSFNTNLLSDDKKSVLIPDNKFTVVYAGSIGVPNDVDTIIKTFQIIDNPEIELHIIGEGKEKKNLQKYVSENKIQNIIFHKAIPKNQLIAELKKADILWVGLKNSKLYEFGFSFNKIYDYLAVARPIIISTTVENNIIEKAKAGLSVQAENPERISEAINKLFEMSESERNKLGENGKKYLLKNITSEVVAKRFIEEIINTK